MNRIWRSSSRRRSRSSGAMTTNFERSNAICRSMSGSVPLPIDPNPTITIGPSKRACSGRLSPTAVTAFMSVTPNANDDGIAPRAPRRDRPSDVVGLQRWKAVEGDRRIGRGVGAGAFDQHLVADLEAHRQVVRLLLVQHVDRIAGRPGEHAGRERVAVARGPDRIADHLIRGLGEPAELAEVEIDPAHGIGLALAGDQHDLRLDDPGIADQAAARLDDRIRNTIAEMLAERAEDRAPI